MEQKISNRELVWPLEIKYKYFRKIPDCISTSFYFSVPAIIIFIPFIFRSWNELMKNDFSLYFKIFIAGIWTLYGPWFIFKYNQTYELFWTKLSSIYLKDNLESLIHFYDLKIIRISKIISIIWCSLLTAALIIDPSYLKTFGIHGWSDPYQYIFIFFIIYLAHLTALGFTGCYITIKIICSLINNNSVRFNEFDTDNAGGFSCFGHFSLSTTFLFATGSLFIPLLYDYATNSSIVTQFLIFLAVILYGCSIFLVFLIPVTHTFKKAENDKNDIVHEALLEYKKSRVKKMSNSEIEMVELNSYNHLKFLNELKIYPFNFNILFKISLTALIPIIIYLFQMLLDTSSILYNWKVVVSKLGIN
jgi:hypothetical protein